MAAHAGCLAGNGDAALDDQTMVFPPRGLGDILARVAVDDEKIRRHALLHPALIGQVHQSGALGGTKAQGVDGLDAQIDDEFQFHSVGAVLVEDGDPVEFDQPLFTII